MESWAEYLGHLRTGLDGLAVTDRAGATLSTAEGFDRWVAMTRRIHDQGGALYLAGNGGSAMIASHMAADACKNGGLRATAFNDPALLTAVSNDESFADV